MWSLSVYPNSYEKFFYFISSSMRMSGKKINFWYKKNWKSKFYKNKSVNKVEDIDVIKILVSKEEPHGTKNSFKYFIGYNDNDAIRPLCIKLS